MECDFWGLQFTAFQVKVFRLLKGLMTNYVRIKRRKQGQLKPINWTINRTWMLKKKTEA